jgi:hypothetical protein
MLDESGPEELLRQVRAAEAIDPEGRQWPRTKRSDDATAVYLVLTDGKAAGGTVSRSGKQWPDHHERRCRPRGRLPAATDGQARSEGGPPRGRPLCCWLQRV